VTDPGSILNYGAVGIGYIQGGGNSLVVSNGGFVQSDGGLYIGGQGTPGNNNNSVVVTGSGTKLTTGTGASGIAIAGRNGKSLTIKDGATVVSGNNAIGGSNTMVSV